MDDTEVEATISDVVQMFRPYHRVHGELEFRLGSFDATTGELSSGVSRETFEQLERDMTDVLTSDRVWEEIVDYYYLNDAGETLRTRVSFDNRTMSMGRTHIKKETCMNMMVVRNDDPSDACRVACSVEHPVSDLPMSTIVKYVRVKQQKKFVDVRDGHVLWNFELSKTWSASSRDTVEYLQHNSEPRYEIECELIDESGAYMSQRSDKEIAASILMKVKMLLGEETDGRVHVLDSTRRPKRQRTRRGGRASV